MARKKTESMLTRQRRLLKEQRARKAAAKSFKDKASKTLPPKGQTGGNSNKSRGQRKITAKRVAGEQQKIITEAMRKTLKQRAASDKLEKAAKGSKGDKVQTGTRTKGGPLKTQGQSKPTRSRKGAAASTRVQKVKVKVEGQKALPPGKSQKALPAGKKALPPGKKGGPVSTGNRPRRRNVNTNPTKGTQMGTKGGGVKGQPRLPQASIRSAGAASKALSTTGKVAGRISLPLSAYLELKGLKDSLDRGEGYARLPGIISKAVKGNNKKKTTGAKTNSRGRRVGAVPASKPKPSPSKQGMSNIPPKEGTGKGSPNDKPQRSSRPSPQRSSRPSTQPTPRPTRSKTGANDPRNAAYIAARKKLNANSTKAERDKVRDMGIKLFKGMQGNKTKSQSKKPAPKKRPLTAPIKKISETNFFKKKKE